jgi:hypothetical protein
MNIVCFYTEIGRPYLPFIQRMTESAKRVMPESKTILLTPTPSKELNACFDEVLQLKIDSSWKTICFDKSRAILTWQLQSKEPTVYLDPDIEFRFPLEFPEEDVGLLWCKTKLAYPINSGMIFARPGSHDFWQKYANIVASLPSALHSWWADQLAFAVMLGSLHQDNEVISAHGASIKLLPVESWCAAPERANLECPALHYKGIRKGENFAPWFAKRLGEGVPA